MLGEGGQTGVPWTCNPPRPVLQNPYSFLPKTAKDCLSLAVHWCARSGGN